MRTAVYPGSFDPITNGHVNIIKRASRLFDRVIVCMMKNIHKKGMFSESERITMIEASLEGIENVDIMTSSGLVTAFCIEQGADYLIKGLRNFQDFEYELNMERFNHNLCPQVETVFLIAEAQQTWVSSSAVRELISFDADISPYVPEPIVQQIAQFRRRDDESH